jgi:fructoselysine-6-P-deglycase FrlB-like protein
MSIRAMEEEIRSQIEDLPRFASQLRKGPRKREDPLNTVFTGSGDSYATALFAQELSGRRALGSDPYELLRSMDRVRGRRLFIISVSGKTRTNLELARRAKRIARDRVAITANASSPLAKECDRVVLLGYHVSSVLTSGTASFTAGLLACSALLGRLPRSLELDAAYEKSLQWARKISLSDRGSVLFVGSGVHYAMALYGAAKIHEVLGTKAEADYPEQMGHAHLFSIDKEHDTIIFIYSDRDKTRELEKTLGKNDFKAEALRVQGSDKVVNCLKIAFHLQQLALLQAKRTRMKECAFKSDKKRLALSCKLIY